MKATYLKHLNHTKLVHFPIAQSLRTAPSILTQPTLTIVLSHSDLPSSSPHYSTLLVLVHFLHPPFPQFRYLPLSISYPTYHNEIPNNPITMAYTLTISQEQYAMIDVPL